MVKIGWFQVASVLPGTLNWMVTSLLGLFLSSSFSASYFVLKVTSSFLLFVAILNTIHNRLSFTHYSLKQSNLKTVERLINIRIRKFERDIFSIPLTLTSSETRREKWIFLNQNSNYMIKNRPGEQMICSI